MMDIELSKLSSKSDPLAAALFSPANPFWQKGTAQLFTVNEKTMLVGFSHPDYIHEGQPYATFGYWRSGSANDDHGALLGQFEAWARAHGAQRIIGPIHFKSCYDYRLRLDHFSDPPFWGEPHHPDFMPAKLESLGYSCLQRYYTDCISEMNGIRAEARVRLPPLLENLNEVILKPFTAADWGVYRTQMLSLVNRVFKNNLVFTEINAFDYALLYSEAVIARVCADTSFFVVNEPGELVGFCFNTPDPNSPQRLLVKTIGVLPEYRLGGRTFVKALAWILLQSQRYSELAFCLMAEDNMAHRLARRYCDISKSYGLFAKNLF
jgi:hypothetical protein